MKKLFVYYFILCIFSIVSAEITKTNTEEDDFWKLADLADQADKESFREAVGKVRKAANELKIFEAEFYLKEAKKYLVDMDKDKKEYEGLEKLVETQKKAKLKLEKEEKERNTVLEEGEVIINETDLESDSLKKADVKQNEENELIFNKVPVYYWHKTLSGETKYILRYKQMFCIISYDPQKNEYIIEVGQRKTFLTFIEVMKYAVGEVNYKGSVTDCVEVDAHKIYIE